ncbi:MAG: hypothetical protein IJ526_00460 [Lachnospiraceae bacterium]|nr:hypothetical protein [Lachnospiraceae bacterium]
MTKIKRAQEILKQEYEIAKTLEYVTDPIAWALHETWKLFDRIEVQAMPDTEAEKE